MFRHERSKALASAVVTEDVVARLRRMGFPEPAAELVADHLLDADRRGKRSHGVVRLEWLESVARRPDARPTRSLARREFERWDGGDAFGYVTMGEICDAQLAAPPERARLVVAGDTFPIGVLGYWVRRLALGGLVALLTATSPRRLASPEGGPPLAGTNPLAIGVPSSDGRPLVADVSPGTVTHGHVLLGEATPDDLVPFGGEQAHKAFALAVGLHALVDALAGGDAPAAVLLVARPEADPVPALRRLAAGVRLPGDSVSA
jgi:L-2-hydroxycarboxylate dehydrogenase (NAD+)